jgi:hypothetical protein
MTTQGETAEGAIRNALMICEGWSRVTFGSAEATKLKRDLAGVARLLRDALRKIQEAK